MAELSKYDMFLEELSSLEKEIYYFIQKGAELIEANEALSNRINQLEKENETLKKRLSEIESKISKSMFNEENLFGVERFNAEEREALKNKISELIARIDYHLRS
ncbi:MAG: hypothetical protein QHH13_11480 [Melioribacter sp.]|uniref:hypothetical protein n=1 Tax=Rosettibacter primus TaxID=3111523 RepID=UPI00247D0C8B|nr:hypothetical protein [Melioribacter sp.]